MRPQIPITGDPETFPPEARDRVRTLQHAHRMALRAGDLIQARGLRISLQIEAIFWLPDEDLGVGV